MSDQGYEAAAGTGANAFKGYTAKPNGNSLLKLNLLFIINLKIVIFKCIFSVFHK